MEFWEVLQGRRSCRKYQEKPVEEEKLQKVLMAANLAPSPVNRQPWEFVVIRSGEIKQKVFESVRRSKDFLFEASGWKWLGKYSVAFLLEAPVLVAVVGDPAKTGAERFFLRAGERATSMPVPRRCKTCCFPPRKWGWAVYGFRSLTARKSSL